MTDVPKPLLTYLEKRGYVEQSPAGWFVLDTGSVEIAVDLRGDMPKIGVLLNNDIQENGHGITRVDDVRNEVLYLWNKSAGNRPAEGTKEPGTKKEEEPVPQSKQWQCSKCGKPVDMKQADDTASKWLNVFCKDCEPKFDEKPAPKEPEVVAPPVPAKNGLLDLIKSYVGNDVLEVFGDSGTGKSKFALELARQVIASGKTVFYLDTERNLTEKDIAMLKGCQYKYTPVIAEIGQITRKLPQVDVVVIDSIGFPVLTAYARMSMKQKGDALLNLIAIFGDLKEWAYRNNGVAIVINQPESDFNKEPGHLIRPFGDKSQFAAKEIWKTEIVQRGKVTKTAINAFRSRSIGHGTKIADMEVTDKGTAIKAQGVVK